MNLVTTLLRLELRPYLGLALHGIGERGVVAQNDESFFTHLKRFDHRSGLEMRRNTLLT